MPTIKERRQLLETEHRNYMLETYRPAVRALTEECEAVGHVNMETKTREDGSQYYICDNCKKLIELQ